MLATSRFAKMAPGYVEISLGLLSESEAVTLLLGTAEVSDPTAEQSVASKIIVKQCGALPLYLTMVGKLIFEFQSEAWHEEVVAMLAEDRDSLFVEDGSRLGSTIVGSSLDQVKEPGAKALFTMLAVAAEDVPVPMSAVELVWCAHNDVVPPLSRLQLIKCRKYAFELLDRNLVLGETVNGIYMHDGTYWSTSTAMLSMSLRFASYIRTVIF